MPLKKRILKPARGYNPKTHRTVGMFMAALDDQLRLLKRDLAGLTPAQLAWQPKTGMNTIGMLLTHLAIVEIWWFIVAPKSLNSEAEWDRIIREHLKIGGDDDGMPVKKGGKHPKVLQGKPLSFYMNLMDKARKDIHKEVRTWSDSTLSKTYTHRNKFSISREWTIYHVLEHFSGHYGQILLLKHMMRDAGVLKDSKK